MEDHLNKKMENGRTPQKIKMEDDLNHFFKTSMMTSIKFFLKAMEQDLKKNRRRSQKKCNGRRPQKKRKTN